MASKGKSIDAPFSMISGEDELFDMQDLDPDMITSTNANHNQNNVRRYKGNRLWMVDVIGIIY